MTKTEMVEKIANISGVSKAVAARVIDALLEGITDALSNNESVVFTGFGTFALSNRAPRTGLNPQTREKINIPASRGVKFKVGKKLKDAVQ